MPWLVRRAAYLLTSNAVHSDGNASYFRRWQREHKAPLCDFGETVQYMVPTVKGLPKLEPRFFEGIWLSKDTSTNDSIIGIPYKIVRARTIRRQVGPEKRNQQLLDCIGNRPWTPTTSLQTAPQVIPLPPQQRAEASATTTGAQTTHEPQHTTGTEIEQRPVQTTPDAKPRALLGSPMATSPTSQHSRPALPLPSPKREMAEEVTEGSAAKQQRTTEAPAPLEGPSVESPTTRTRIQSVTVTTKKGTEITTTTCDDPDAAATERILLEPFVTNTEGFDKQKTIKGMKHEVGQMKTQQVYTEVKYDDLTPEEQSNVIESKWAFRDKTTEVRARIAKGFTEVISDLDSVYASTPMLCILRILLTVALARSWVAATGDITTAFLHATAATSNLYMWPPAEFYNAADRIAWKLNKAIYGLRSSPEAWQDHLAQTLQQLNMRRLKAEPNVYCNSAGTVYIMAYVDDLLFVGEPQQIQDTFRAIQKQLLLRPTGTLTMGQTIAFLSHTEETTMRLAWQTATLQISYRR